MEDNRCKQKGFVEKPKSNRRIRARWRRKKKKTFKTMCCIYIFNTFINSTQLEFLPCSLVKRRSKVIHTSVFIISESRNGVSQSADSNRELISKINQQKHASCLVLNQQLHVVARCEVGEYYVQYWCQLVSLCATPLTSNEDVSRLSYSAS